MFKKLKDKIAEEVKQSPSKLSATVSQFAQAVVSPSSSSIVDPSFTSDDPFSISEDVEETPRNTPTKSGFMSVDLRETPTSNTTGIRSRRSSTNSVLSEASVIFPSYDYAGSSFHLQSDLESASELDDSVSSNLTSTSKEQLVSYLRKSQHRYNKYKGRWHDVIKHCKELERENTKAKAILSESQDKALRRIAELKEQCLLEKQAKAHLEEILRNDLEEKDHLIMTLNTKIDLLKLSDSSISPEGPVEKLDVPVTTSESLVDFSNESTAVPIPSESEDIQKEKVKKLEILLAKCKDAIKIHKEKVKEFSIENDLLKKERASNEQSHSQQLHWQEAELSAARDQIAMLEHREEESALSLAETKRTIHSEMEVKEEQIKHLRDNIRVSNDERENLVEKCNQLQTQLSELQHLQELEITSDNEKQMQELSRVKQEAVKLLQAETSKNISDLKDSWAAKLHEVELQLKDSTEVKKQLEDQCIALQEQTLVLQTQNAATLDQFKYLEKNNAALQDQMKDIETRYTALQDLHNVFETESINLKDELKLLENQNTALKDQANSFENHVLALLDKYPPNVSSVENNHTLQQKMDEILRNAENHSLLVIETLQKKVDDMVKEKSQNQQMESVPQLKDDLLKKDGIISSQSTIISELQTSKIRVNNENSELRARLCELDDTNTRFLDDRTHSMANEAALQSELYNLRLSHDEQVMSLKNQLAQALKDFQESEASINIMHGNKKELENKLEELTKCSQQADELARHQIQQMSEEIIVLSLRSQQAESTVIDELSVQNVNISEELHDVTKQLQAEKENLKKTTLELNQLQQRVEHREELHAQITKNYEQAKEELEIERERSLGMIETLEKTKLELAKLQVGFAEMEVCNAQVIKNYNEVKQELEIEKELSIVKGDTIEMTNVELNQLRERVSDMEELSVHIDKVTESLLQVTEQLQFEKQLCAVKTEDLEKATFELNQLRESVLEIKELQAQIAQLSELRQQEKEDRLSETQRLNDYINALTLDNRELAVAQAEAQQNVEELKETVIEYNNLRAALEQMEYKCNEFEIKHQSHQEELLYVHNQVTMLTAENLALADSAEVIAQEHLQACNERDAVIKDLQTGDSEKLMHDALLKNRYVEMEKEVNVMRKTNEELHSELDMLKAESVTYDNENKCMQEKVEWIKTEIKTLAKKVGKQQNDTQEQSSECSLVQSASAIKDFEQQSKSEKHIDCEKTSLNDELQILIKATEKLNIVNQQLHSELEATQLAKAVEHEKLILIQQQLQESLAALQLKEEEVKDLEETHVSNISQLAKEFQSTLNNKEEELIQAHEDEKAGIEQSEGIQLKQLRDQLKSMRSEAREREEMIDSLRDTHNQAIKALELELASASMKIEDVRMTCQSELREADKKWRQCLDREVEKREASHKEEVQALSNEWQLERKDPKFTQQAHAQELTSTSQVAVAAVESGTGSIELLHRQLMTLTKELNETKRCHKLETSELRRLMAIQGSEGPTELEYLRNILFEYMMGREPIVLVRVIAAVLKFDSLQTNMVIEKEENKQSLLGQLGII